MLVAKRWGYSLLGICCGKFLGKDDIQKFAKSWEFHTKVAFYNKGWIVFSFTSELEMHLINSRRPYAIFGTALVLYDLPPEFRFDAAPNLNIEVWASLPRLPMQLWNTTAITCIATAVGSPLQVDPSSLARNHTNGPRFQVLINALDEPLEELEIEMHNGNWFKQKIVLEFLPRICSNCGTVGHSMRACGETGDRGSPHNLVGRTNVRHQPQRPHQESQARGPPPRDNPWLNKNKQNQMEGERRAREPPAYAPTRSKSRGRSRMGREAPQNRSKSTPKRKGKTPVGGNRYPSNNDMGRNKVWQEKAKENPTEPAMPNAHIRFESSPSSFFSNHASTEVPGNQAIRFQYSGDGGNTNMVEDSSDEVALDEESSSKGREMDFNTIIPDSLVDESGGMCAKEVPSTPTNFVRNLSLPPLFPYLLILLTFQARELWTSKQELKRNLLWG